MVGKTKFVRFLILIFIVILICFSNRKRNQDYDTIQIKKKSKPSPTRIAASCTPIVFGRSPLCHHSHDHASDVDERIVPGDDADEKVNAKSLIRAAPQMNSTR